MTANNDIHPTAVVDHGVELGIGNQIGPYAVILGPCLIGDDNWIGPHTTIGTPAQQKLVAHGPPGSSGSGTGIRIGNGNVIREYVTVHQGTREPTEVGDECYLMAYVHIPHDAVVETGSVLANAVQMGGHTWVGRGATLGLGSVVHQFSAIGAGSMVGMHSVVSRDVLPFSLVMGSPAVVRGANRRGLEQLGVLPEAVLALDNWYRSQTATRPASGIPAVEEEFRRFGARSKRAQQ